MNGGMIFTVDEAREILRIDGTDNDAQIMALVEAIPAYLEITAGYTASGKTTRKKASAEYSPLAKTAARFILQLWYFGESADTDKLKRVIDNLLKALSYER